MPLLYALIAIALWEILPSLELSTAAWVISAVAAVLTYILCILHKD